jgi:hypothetical protein
VIKNDLPLIHALIDAFLLLESAGPNEVNPDIAVRGMENMASSLLMLEQSDQLAFRAKLEHIAETAQDQGYRDFVAALPDMIGLPRG